MTATLNIKDSATGEDITIRLAAATPVEVDTVLYRLYRAHLSLRAQVAQNTEHLHYLADDKRDYYNQTWGMDFDQVMEAVQAVTGYRAQGAQDALAKRATLVQAISANRAEAMPLEAEYRSRPWTRAFLVTDGHVHSSQYCSTCFATTEFTWVTALSGSDEAEIVSQAADRACTVCYPSAPTLRDFEKASPLFTEEEAARNAAREVRATEKAARQAKRIANALTADGSEFTVVTAEYPTPEHMMRPGRNPITTSREHFKTERAAIQWAVGEIASGHEHTTNTHYNRVTEAIAQIVSAYATKHGVTEDEARAVVDAKVEAKVKRDGWDGRMMGR